MKGGSVLTVNPDTQNRQILKRSFFNLPNLSFVNGRWVGGTLTNFRRIFYHLLFMIEYCKLYSIPLKEISPLMVYFRGYFEGISQMKRLPSCVFVLSYYENYNDHFLRETNILGIPSLGSFNCKENLMLDLCIPGNGSNTQSLEFFSYVIRNSYLATLIKYSEICKNNNYNFNNISFK
jgi:ribosomal protein S2